MQFLCPGEICDGSVSSCVEDRRERERVERPDAGQFHGPRVIVVAANRSATWPDAACHGAARWPSLFPLVVSVTPLRADFHRRCY